MDMLHLFLVVLGYICLCLSGLAFVGSLALAAFSGTKKGFLVPAIYLSIIIALIVFMMLYPSGSEAFSSIVFFTICIIGQFIWVGKLRHQQNRVLKWSFTSTLMTSCFLLCGMILMIADLAIQ